MPDGALSCVSRGGWCVERDDAGSDLPMPFRMALICPHNIRSDRFFANCNTRTVTPRSFSLLSGDSASPALLSRSGKSTLAGHVSYRNIFL
ncbi:hypothetical protein GGR01_000489 [Acetobacter oeni]|nr:hypothetical protein [Acetobacter oeni]